MEKNVLEHPLEDLPFIKLELFYNMDEMRYDY